MAKQNIELYQARLVAAFDRLVKYWSFKNGDLVLTVKRPMKMMHKSGGKFEPKWEGPYAVEGGRNPQERRKETSPS